MNSTEKVVLYAVNTNFGKTLKASFDPDDYGWDEVVAYARSLESVIRNNRTLLEALLSEPSDEEKDKNLKL